MGWEHLSAAVINIEEKRASSVQTALQYRMLWRCRASVCAGRDAMHCPGECSKPKSRTSTARSPFLRKGDEGDGVADVTGSEDCWEHFACHVGDRLAQGNTIDDEL